LTDKPMDAEKALADMEDGCPCREHLHPKAHSPCLFIGRCVCYFGKAECRWTGHARARTLARAAFEEGISWADSNDYRTPGDLPKWLTETSR